MTWLAVFLFTLLAQFRVSEASRYKIDDQEGTVAILLLVAAIIVCIISVVFFFYIVYKLWNGDFERGRHYYGRKSFIRETIVDEVDSSRAPKLDKKPVYTFHNEVAAAEEAKEASTTVVERAVNEDSLKTEQVILSKVPPTEEPEIETQELVVVFHDEDE